MYKEGKTEQQKYL